MKTRPGIALSPDSLATEGHLHDGLRVHGGLTAQQRSLLGSRADGLLDLSVNVNPYGPSPRVLDAVRATPLAAYPDATAGAVREAYGAHWKVPPDRVVFGNGAAELLWTLIRALLRPSAHVLTIEPTFSEMTAAARVHGCRLLRFEATAEQAFAVDLQAVSKRMTEAQVHLVYLCTPNNPTGVATPMSDIVALAARHPDVWVVIDQAFLSLSERHEELRSVPLGNVICVRSLTKEHSLAGLRLGYLLADARVARRVEAARPAWSTSAPAQAAALACLDDEAFVAQSRARMRDDRERVAQVLRNVGLNPLPSDAPYLLFSTPDAVALHRTLLHDHAVLLRDCHSFGLPEHLRVCGLQESDAQRFQQALATSLGDLR